MRRVLALWLLVCGLALAVPLTPSAAWAQAAPNRAIAFVDADIAAVADEVLGRQLRLKFVISPDVSGAMTFQLSGRASDAQLLAGFETALALSGAVLVREGDRVLIVPRDRARAAATPVRVAESAAVSYRAGYSVLAVPLRYANAGELAKLIQGVYGDGLVAYSDEKLGLLVLSGTARDLQAVAALIGAFDRDQFQSANISVVPLKASEPDVVAGELDRVLRAQGQSGVTLVPVSRLRSLIVAARSPALRDLALRLIVDLDRHNPDGASQLHVYRPLYSSAQELSDVLGQLYGIGQRSPGGTQPVSPPGGGAGAGGSASPGASEPAPVANGQAGLAEADLRIAVDRRTDTLLVWARPTRWAELSDLLQKIDLPPDQVLIEATVLEVTLGDEFRFGVDLSYLDGNDTRFLNTGSENGSVTAKAPGLSITYVNGDLKAAISTLAAKTTTRVVSAPKLVVLEGQTANLQVGDQVPVSTGSSQSTSTNDVIVVNTEYRDTGIILKVTPRVRGDGRVDLELAQEVSSVARNTSSGIDSPTIQTRKFDSRLMVEDGRVIALGGLISETTGKSTSGLPILSDIPVLGALFGNQSQDTRRTELIILVKPTVLKATAGRTYAIDEILAQMETLRNDGSVMRLVSP